MPFVSIEEAKARGGVCLVTSRGIPVPWGEAAKAILQIKGIPHLRVGQEAGGDNSDLVEWTGIRSAPILIINDEPPLDRWADILVRLERLQPEPRLIPEDEASRVQMFGLAHELLGPDGYCANRRNWINAQPENRAALSADALLRLRAHGTGETDRAPLRIRQILEHFGAILREQYARGSRFVLGDSITAIDLYWAASCALSHPLSEPLCPLNPFIRAVYTEHLLEVLSSTDALLLKHRDYIYQTYLELPVQL